MQLQKCNTTVLLLVHYQQILFQFNHLADLGLPVCWGDGGGEVRLTPIGQKKELTQKVLD